MMDRRSKSDCTHTSGKSSFITTIERTLHYGAKQTSVFQPSQQRVVTESGLVQYEIVHYKNRLVRTHSFDPKYV